MGITDIAADVVCVGDKLSPLCGHPLTGMGVPTGLALAGGPGSTTPTRRPLAKPVLGAVADTFASMKQLASPKRSSVKAKA